MNRFLWGNNIAEYPCPRCSERVEISKHGLISETLDSLKDNQYHENGIVFPTTTCLASSLLKCNRCGDISIVSYEVINDVRHTDDNGVEVEELNILSIFPAPKIISIPNSCAKSIGEILMQSFRLFWIDTSSCGNKIRLAVEAIMDEFGIQSVTPQGKSMSLHERILEFEKRNSKIGKYLLSVKWIGNTASHTKDLNKEEILDAYDILEYSLELLYNDREKEIDLKTDLINRSKGHGFIH